VCVSVCVWEARDRSACTDTEEEETRGRKKAERKSETHARNHVHNTVTPTTTTTTTTTTKRVGSLFNKIIMMETSTHNPVKQNYVKINMK